MILKYTSMLPMLCFFAALLILPTMGSRTILQCKKNRTGWLCSSRFDLCRDRALLKYVL